MPYYNSFFKEGWTSLNIYVINIMPQINITCCTWNIFLAPSTDSRGNDAHISFFCSNDPWSNRVSEYMPGSASLIYTKRSCTNTLCHIFNYSLLLSLYLLFTVTSVMSHTWCSTHYTCSIILLFFLYSYLIYQINNSLTV